MLILECDGMCSFSLHLSSPSQIKNGILFQKLIYLLTENTSTSRLPKNIVIEEESNSKCDILLSDNAFLAHYLLYGCLNPMKDELIQAKNADLQKSL